MTESITIREKDSILMPHEAVITEIIEENSTIKTFVTEYSDSEQGELLDFMPGQFMMVSVPGHGEAPISISSTPDSSPRIELSIRRAGRLTSAIHTMKKGDHIGLRGPYGRPFPMDSLKGHDMVFIAGGIGLAPLRSVINYCLKQKGEYGKITLLYGSRTPSDMAFKKDLDDWSSEESVALHLTVDMAEPGWYGSTGLVTTMIDRIETEYANTFALLCGPPVMMSAAWSELESLGFADNMIITTMERNMKCGIGLCGHCHMGNRLVCRHGPVFTLAELKEIEGGL